MVGSPSLGIIARRIAFVGVLLVSTGLAARSSLAGTPSVAVPADTLVPNVRVLSFELGAHVPAGYPVRRFGSPPYRSVDHGVPLLVWTTRQGIVDHIEARQADSLNVDGRSLSAGYRAFRNVLTSEGWKPFGCGSGVRGLSFTDRFRSLTFVRWSRQGAWASVSLASQPPLFGVCENWGARLPTPPPVNGGGIPTPPPVN